MKIQSSSISMSSTHLEKSFQFMEHATIEGRASDDLEGVILSLSKDAEDGSYAKAIKSYEKQQKEEAKQRQEQNLKSLAQVMQAKRQENYGFDISDEYDLKLELLRQLLEMLGKGKNLTKIPYEKLNKDADVGAIYLGNADTQYSFKDESLNTQAVLRKTGVYLKESTGKVGTVSHVDLAV